MIKHLKPRSKLELIKQFLPKYIVLGIITLPLAICTLVLSSGTLAIALFCFPIINLYVWARDFNSNIKWDGFLFPYWRFGFAPFCWYLHIIWKVEMEDLYLIKDLNID